MAAYTVTSPKLSPSTAPASTPTSSLPSSHRRIAEQQQQQQQQQQQSQQGLSSTNGLISALASLEGDGDQTGAAADDPDAGWRKMKTRHDRRLQRLGANPNANLTRTLTPTLAQP